MTRAGQAPRADARGAVACLIALLDRQDLTANWNVCKNQNSAGDTGTRKANMTRKDYTLIAKAIASVEPHDVSTNVFYHDIVEAIVNALRDDNGAFDQARFEAVVFGD